MPSCLWPKMVDWWVFSEDLGALAYVGGWLVIVLVDGCCALYGLRCTADNAGVGRVLAGFGRVGSGGCDTRVCCFGWCCLGAWNDCGFRGGGAVFACAVVSDAFGFDAEEILPSLPVDTPGGISCLHKLLLCVAGLWPALVGFLRASQALLGAERADTTFPCGGVDARADRSFTVTKSMLPVLATPKAAPNAVVFFCGTTNLRRGLDMAKNSRPELSCPRSQHC